MVSPPASLLAAEWTPEPVRGDGFSGQCVEPHVSLACVALGRKRAYIDAMPTQPPRLPPPAPEDAAARNMRLLVLLRWMAVGGQLATILIVHWGHGFPSCQPPRRTVHPGTRPG